MAKQWKKSLEQSDILSDGTPFDGANIDERISNAGASQTDIQNAILSDGEPFPGRFIGSGWLSGVANSATGDVSYNETGTVLSINGSGTVFYLQLIHSGTGDSQMDVNVDGTTLFTTQGNGDSTYNFNSKIPFSSSFVIEKTTIDDQGTEAEVNYVLD